MTWENLLAALRENGFSWPKPAGRSSPGSRPLWGAIEMSVPETVETTSGEHVPTGGSITVERSIDKAETHIKRLFLRAGRRLAFNLKESLIARANDRGNALGLAHGGV